MLGWHWLAWGEGCASPVLSDAELASTCLGALADALGLTAVQPPTAQRAERGIVAVVLLAESHAAIHTDVQAGMLFVDVFSCRSFDVEQALAVVRAHYGPTAVHHELTSRGRGDG